MAFWVGAGILLSRISGLVRERALAYFFGSSDAGDAFKAALRIPNLLQNLLGEGVLSGSFIPEYVKSKAQSPDEARKLAWSLLWILSLVVAVLSAIGSLSAKYLVVLLAPGFEGEKQRLTIELVQILFPGVGLLVISAWCLGVLNAHRRFFLSYAAPVIWNFTIVGFLIYNRDLNKNLLAISAAWGLAAGSMLQLSVQWPATWALLKPINLKVVNSGSLKRVFQQFWPSVIGRGVVQISSYFDNILASFLSAGSVSILSFAQTIYLLPISLFGMSVSAAELPEMAARSSQIYILRARMFRALQNLLFYTVPTSVFLILFAAETVGLLFETGAFELETRVNTAWVLTFYACGIVASTQSRLWVSALYAQQKSRTALRSSILRVTTSLALSLILSQHILLHYHSQLPPAAGIALGATFAAWLELWWLKRQIQLQARAEDVLQKQAFALLLAVLIPACLVKLGFIFWSGDIRIQGLLAAGVTGIGYLILTAKVFKHPHAQSLIERLTKLIGRKS